MTSRRIAVVTGANRGIGKPFMCFAIERALRSGAREPVVALG